MNYLVQRRIDGCVSCLPMNECQLIDYINMDDIHDEEYVVFDMSEFGKVKQLYYKGWQPNCLIELVDENGEVVVRGYGEDH